MKYMIYIYEFNTKGKIAGEKSLKLRKTSKVEDIERYPFRSLINSTSSYSSLLLKSD